MYNIHAFSVNLIFDRESSVFTQKNDVSFFLNTTLNCLKLLKVLHVYLIHLKADPGLFKKGCSS